MSPRDFGKNRVRSANLIIAVKAIAVATTIALTPTAMGAQSGDEMRRQDITNGSAKPLDPSAADCCETVDSTANRPNWLPGVLKKLETAQANKFRIHQHALFKVGDSPRFLAIVWLDRQEGSRWFQIFRVEIGPAGKVRMAIQFEDKKELLEIVVLTGTWKDGDGMPSVVLWQGSGGSGYRGYTIRILKLSAGVEDVTPKALGRPIRVEDLDGDSRFELISSDDRWANFYYGCGACGPRVPIVLERVSDGFQPACRSYMSYYIDWVNRIGNLVHCCPVN